MRCHAVITSLPKLHQVCPPGFAELTWVRHTAGRAVEENNAQDCLVFSWCLLLHLLQSQHPGMGPKVFWCSAIRHLVCPVLPLVRHFSASGLCWVVLWLQVTNIGGPSAHQQDPQTDTRAAMVHEPCVQHPDRRHPPIWGSLHRAILHSHLHVATSVLLPVWLLVPRLCDPGHHMRRDHHRAVLLPAVQ